MESAFLYFIIFFVLLLTLVNSVLMIGGSMVMVKIYEIVKTQEDRWQKEEAKRRNSRGLNDITTSQIPYDLPR